MNERFLNEIRPIVVSSALNSGMEIAKALEEINKLVEQIIPVAKKYGIAENELVQYIEFISKEGTRRLKD